jgi:hypothetical protein
MNITETPNQIEAKANRIAMLARALQQLPKLEEKLSTAEAVDITVGDFDIDRSYVEDGETLVIDAISIGSTFLKGLRTKIVSELEALGYKISDAQSVHDIAKAGGAKE